MLSFSTILSRLDYCNCSIQKTVLYNCNSNLLLPKSLNFGERGFSVSGPKIGNSHSIGFATLADTSVLEKQLRSMLFKSVQLSLVCNELLVRGVFKKL